MKNIIRIVLTQKDVEEIVKNHIQSSIPEAAKCYYRHNTKWEEFSAYRKESEDCIMVEFSLEDAEKEAEKETELPVGETDWNSEDIY